MKSGLLEILASCVLVPLGFCQSWNDPSSSGRVTVLPGTPFPLQPFTKSRCDVVLMELPNGNVEVFQPYRAGQCGSNSTGLLVTFGSDVPSGNAKVIFDCDTLQVWAFRVQNNGSIPSARTLVEPSCGVNGSPSGIASGTGHSSDLSASGTSSGFSSDTNSDQAVSPYTDGTSYSTYSSTESRASSGTTLTPATRGSLTATFTSVALETGQPATTTSPEGPFAISTSTSDVGSTRSIMASSSTLTTSPLPSTTSGCECPCSSDD